MITIIFLGGGMTLLAIPFWFSIDSYRALIWFREGGHFALCFSAILLAQALGHMSDGEKAWARSSILTIIAAACAGTWIILILIVGSNATKTFVFLQVVTWSCVYVLISLVLLKVFNGLNHEINHKVGQFGKIGVIVIVIT